MKPPHILVIDDNPEDRLAVRMFLDQVHDGDYICHEAAKGREGVTAALALKPDCILLDYHMPDMNGLEVLSLLATPTGELPCAIVMLTGDQNDEVITAALKNGAQDYFLKVRLDPELLDHTVRGAIDRFAKLSAKRRLAARYKEIVSHSNEAIISVSPDGCLETWNDGAERLFGWSGTEAVGNFIQTLIVPADQRHAFEKNLVKLATGYAIRLEAEYLHKDGHRREALTVLTPLVEHGVITAVSMISRDIRTERRQAFLLGLADDLQAEAEEITPTAIVKLARFLNLSRVVFSSLNEAKARFVANQEYNDGAVRPATQKYPLEAFGNEFAEELRAGRAVAVSDSILDPRINPMNAQDDTPKARSYATVPLLSDGRLQAMLYVADHQPRIWTEEDIAFLSEVGNRIWTALRDRTLKHQLEQKVDEFIALADGIPALCWMAEADGHVYWYNRRWYEYTGTSLADLEGWAWESIHDPATLSIVSEAWSHSISTGTPFEMTFPLRGADGVFHPFMTRVAPLLDAKGQVCRWLGINMEISEATQRETALNRATTRLRASEQRLQVIFDTAPIGIIIAEAPSGRLISGNRQAEAIFRYPIFYSPDVNSYGEWKFFHPDGRRVEAHEYPLARALAGEEHSELDVLYQHSDDTKAWMRLIASPITLDNKITGAVVVILDIDKKVRAIEELTRIKDTLEVRVIKEVEERQKTQLQLLRSEKMAALGQLAGGVAHDFNNILQGFEGGASLIQRNAHNPDMILKYGAMLEDTARRGSSVTRRLLAFARRGELTNEPLDVSLVLDSLQEVFAHTLGRDISVQIEVAEGLPAMLSDRGQLETVLVNLATNARDALSDGGTIIIAADQETIRNGGSIKGLKPGNYIRLRITDNGTGMDEATLSHVMEPFFTTKEQGKGTGLGLSMARGFIEQSGGSVSVESKVGRGTTVTLWLPVTQLAPASLELPKELARTADGGHPRVLLVDDDEMVLDVLADQLVEHGYDVLQAKDGYAALEIANAGNSIDLIVSDLAMPGMNGIEVIRQVHERYPGLPAILLTGFAGETATFASAEALMGKFSLLRKPISGPQLAERVAALLTSLVH